MIQRVAVLYGGDSAERDVSLRSGIAVSEGLQEVGHQVQLIDPPETPLDTVNWRQFDTAFIALHGTDGEDGTVQSQLEQLRVNYTGSSVEASQLAFNKAAAKELFVKAGLPTPASECIQRDEADDSIEAKAAKIGYPLVVKPCRQGSSVGVSIVRQSSELSEALRGCFQYDSIGLLEEYVSGEEWTVGLINHRCLCPIRITAATEFYDYGSKYEDDRTKYEPADLATQRTLVAKLHEVSRDACANLGTSGVARVDLRVDSAGQPWLLEVNTIPGFTSTSLVPKAAAADGIHFPQLCDMALQTAICPVTQRMAG